jgi:tripartite-type tricarboxylate transporter receptor subunit TctC
MDAHRTNVERRRVLRAAGAAVAALTLPARADAFPSHPVKLIIPYPPGGAGDIIGRLLGVKLGQVLGQPVVIDNRGGGAQVIATELTAHAPPDGYTIFLASTTHSINPALSCAITSRPDIPACASRATRRSAISTARARRR